MKFGHMNDIMATTKQPSKTQYSYLSSGTEVIVREHHNMPQIPGVYRMLNKDDEVLYVGKAKNLKRRIASYTKPHRQSIRIQRMIAQTVDIIIITTETEVEALLLEADLIKRYAPRYNILLRDDKSFPMILLTDDHAFPQVLKHRGTKRRKGEYFGPFASVWAVNDSLNLLQRAFLLRTCSDNVFANRTRPCLLYQIKRCSAPCVDKILKSDYYNLVQEARAFLSGDSKRIQQKFAKEMQKASDIQEFELAAQYRDRINALTKVQTQNGITLNNIEDSDLIGAYQIGGKTCLQVFFFRSSRNYGNCTYFPVHGKGCSINEVMEAFIGQFYAKTKPPTTILLSHDIPSLALTRKALTARAGKTVKISIPIRGEKVKLISHAITNAREALERRLRETATQRQLIKDLAQVLKLSKTPQRIEVFDNSHISGTRAVGGMIVAGPEGFIKKSYRKFNIVSKISPGDDYAMMREVIARRFKNCVKETPDSKKQQWPDLILIDGGKGHLSAVKTVLKQLNISGVSAVAIAKGPDRNAGREHIFIEETGPLILDANNPVLYFLQRLRDEAHRFAIGTHRQRRAKSIVRSVLEEVPGVGSQRKKALLHHFGAAKAVAEASITDLEAVNGINRSIATRLYDWFHTEH